MCLQQSWNFSWFQSAALHQVLKGIQSIQRVIAWLAIISDVSCIFCFLASTMKEMPCFCLILSLLWEQMVKAYKYMSGIFLVTHPSKQQASDCSRQPTKMDINVLEERYNCLKQKQKLQTHVIVFKTGMFKACRTLKSGSQNTWKSSSLKWHVHNWIEKTN